eukprot:1187249-Prorocentrum_minimum.AAC.3
MSSSRCLVSLLVNVCTLGCAHANILPIHCFILAVQISPASRRDEVNQGGHPQQDPTGFRSRYRDRGRYRVRERVLKGNESFASMQGFQQFKKKLSQAAGGALEHIQQSVKDLEHVNSVKAIRDYQLVQQVGSGGVGLLWKIYSARPKRPSAGSPSEVSVWLLDKKALLQDETKSKADVEAALDVYRRDAAQMLRLSTFRPARRVQDFKKPGTSGCSKTSPIMDGSSFRLLTAVRWLLLRHPGVVRLLEPLEENRTHMAMVSEAILTSLHSLHKKDTPQLAQVFHTGMGTFDRDDNVPLQRVSDESNGSIYPLDNTPIP